jgi:outer membrane receptor for ferrienterochelin and colicins
LSENVIEKSLFKTIPNKPQAVILQRRNSVNMKTAILSLWVVCAWQPVFGQFQKPLDSLQAKSLPEVVVTATRTERQVGTLPLPVTVVGQAQVRNMGSLRLNDVLAEQTGLVIVPQVNGFGNGVQVQGFNPDYTLILVDGEPLVGRSAGVLELTRLAVGNIKKIEIVKGPSSSIYGSEALAGVINIITQNPDGLRGSVQSRYGTNQTLDLSGDFNYKKDKLGLYVFANRYQTGGYDLTPNTFGNTVDPFHNYTLNSKLTYDFSANTRFTLAGRYFNEQQTSSYDAGGPANPLPVVGGGQVSDWNLNPVLSHRFSAKLKLTTRFYATGYQANSAWQQASDGRPHDSTTFRQTFSRPEVVAEYFINDHHTATLGAGHIRESVEASRYTERKAFSSSYVFFQYEWHPIKRLSLIAGGRYDAHSEYQSQFSPKVSAQYGLNRWLAVRGSVGVGFKAPDFRQLYLNFNNAVAGYTVYGAREIVGNIERLQAQGQLLQVLFPMSAFGNLRAESSVAYNLGLKLTPRENLHGSLNLFHNEVQDLIEFQPVAMRNNGQLIYSYFNLSRVFTQGLELEGTWSFARHFNLGGGYQLLLARDRATLDQIRKGNVFARDPATLVTRRVQASDYGGLFNRSRHSANLKLFYENPAKGLSGSVRAIYRGRFGFADLNSNQILDADSEYAPGFVTWNLSVAKTFRQLVRVQVGVDNVLGYTDPAHLPNVPGRLVWGSLALMFGKNE